MYKYELINNHYIVEIDGGKYLVDTGCRVTILRRNKQVVINGRPYGHYGMLPEDKFVESSKFIGCDIDGIISYDVISPNGLTIYKNGFLDFNVLETSGEEILLNNNGGMLYVKANLPNGIKADILIDTGAKYGYGNFHNGFVKKVMVDHIYDYNFNIGHFDSYRYPVSFEINGKTHNVLLGDSDKVNQYCLMAFDYHAVINITDLFSEYCVFDITNRRLIVK